MARWYQNALTGQQVEVKTLEEDDFYAENSSNWVRVNPTPPEEQPDGDQVVELADMTKAQLLEYADANGIEVNAGWRKADVLNVIVLVEQQSDEDQE